MIRRLPAAVASVALAAVLASGCSTFTKNNDAARIDDHHLSISDYEDIATDLNPSAERTGEVDGASSRSVIGRWIAAQALPAALADNDLPVSDTARADATAGLVATQQGWATYSSATQQLLAEERAPQAAIYEAGVTKSGIVCMRVLAFTDPALADEAIAELDAGTSFVDVSTAENQSNNTYTDQTTGSECVSTGSLPTELSSALALAPVGGHTAAVTYQDSTYVLQQRPYIEVAGSLDDLFRSTIASLTTSLTATSKVFVDSRYGMWDAASGTVVQTR